jgi:methyltransferase-like protein
MVPAYEQVIYRSLPFGQSHPDRLATLGVLFGMQPAPIERCRVLELGCADGWNLIPAAFELPGSEFVGIDTAEKVIRTGRDDIGELGLTNIRLEQMDVMNVGPELGTFDYIIAHGLYSWVPEPVRDKVLAIAKANLAPQGIAYVSYNALPGCRIREMFRDMMLFHLRGVSEPDERLRRGREFLECFVASQAGAGEDRAFLRDEAQVLLDQPPVVLYHDELGGIYYPLYFHEFVAHAASHGLQFLSEANYADMQPGRYPESVIEQIDRLSAGDRVLRDQYLDFLKCRMFRQTLLSHDDVRIGDEPLAQSVRRLYAATQAKPVSAEPDLRPGFAEEFRGLRGAAVKTAHPLAKAALAILSNAWPEALHFSDLLAKSAALTGEEPDAEDLSEILLATYTSGVIELRVQRPGCISTVSRRPTVSPLARWQASRGNTVTTLRHARVEATGEIERHLMSLLDGTRDVAALTRELRPMLNQPEDVVAKQVEQNLDKLAKFGLLVA